jgi:hypothetical protein
MYTGQAQDHGSFVPVSILEPGFYLLDCGFDLCLFPCLSCIHVDTYLAVVVLLAMRHRHNRGRTMPAFVGEMHTFFYHSAALML